MGISGDSKIMNAPPNLPNRIRLSQSSSEQLTFLKSRTGVTPNILARIAFTLSLKSKFDISQLNPDNDGLEFNLGNLLGEHVQLYELLLLQDSNAATQEDLSNAFVSHIENGLQGLRSVKNLLQLSNQIN